MWRDKGEIPLSVIQSVYKASKLPLSTPSPPGNTVTQPLDEGLPAFSYTT